MTNLRLMRTLMFVPGNQPRMMAKALTVPADGLALDLEDSLPLVQKDEGRELVRAYLAGLTKYGHHIIVRINPLSTRFGKPDLLAIVGPGLDAILLPKVEGTADLQEADELIGTLEKDRGIKTGEIKLLALVETPRGVLNAPLLATSCNRVVALAFGAEYYTQFMGIERTREGTELAYPRSIISVACAAFGILALDTVYSDIRDIEGLIKETQLVRHLGFHGKLVIHPDQVAPVNNIFTPSEEEVLQARKILDAFEAALIQSTASISLNGHMVDTPVALRARRVISLAEVISQKKRQ